MLLVGIFVVVILVISTYNDGAFSQPVLQRHLSTRRVFIRLLSAGKDGCGPYVGDYSKSATYK